MSDNSSIGHFPGAEKWAFDGSVTACFDDMLRRSIPQHDTMRKAVFDVACRYVQPNTDIVDIGCSRGEALAPLVDRFGSANRFVGLEVAEPMLHAARERYAGLIRQGIVDIRNHDLRRGLPALMPSVVLSVLTIQFTPIEYRHQILASIFERLRPGGALVLVEKVLGEHARIDQLMTDLYYRMKSDNGYDADAIARKRLSLEGVLVPLTAKWNEQLLAGAGFREIDCIWRWMNFSAWVAVKPLSS